MNWIVDEISIKGCIDIGINNGTNDGIEVVVSNAS
jgi:hypothetical protein